VLLPFEKPPKISHITLSGPCAAGNRRFLPWNQGRRMKILKKGLTAKANKAKKEEKTRLEVPFSPRTEGSIRLRG
jgi:hypothetical protein